MSAGVVGFRKGRTIMMKSIRMAELAALEPEARAERLREFVAATRQPPNGELAEAEAEIRTFEQRAGVDSDTMRREVSEGRRPETWDVCEWLLLLEERDRLASLAARAG